MSIYLREAHPIDGWWLGGKSLSTTLTKMMVGSNAATDIYDPKTIEERQVVAERCENELAYEMITYVDTMDDAVSHAYAAHPTRLYLIGKDGRVAYAGGLGPFGFKPKEFGEAIDKYLAKEKSAAGVTQ